MSNNVISKIKRRWFKFRNKPLTFDCMQVGDIIYYCDNDLVIKEYIITDINDFKKYKLKVIKEGIGPCGFSLSCGFINDTQIGNFTTNIKDAKALMSLMVYDYNIQRLKYDHT